MSINLDTSIEWFKSKVGKVTYSMTGKRDGSDGTGDCSGMVVTALVKGGASNPGWLLNTEYMHDWLLSNDFELIAFNKSWDMKKGDIVILGLKGQSSGAGGHTFMAVDGTNAIDCAWYGSTTVNAVRIRNENVQPYSMGFYVYRLKTDNIELVEPSKPENNKPKPPVKPRHNVRTYWFDPKSPSLKKVLDYNKAKKYNHKQNKAADGRIMVETFWFNQDSPGKDDLIKFYEKNYWSYDIQIEKK